MALTKTYDLPSAERISRNVGIITGKISFDSSYPTGGESLDLTDRLKTVLAVFFENKGGYFFEYDYTNEKVKAYTPSVQHNHDFTGSALSAHSHKAFTVNATEAAGDVTAFVSITEGDGTAQSSVKIGHPGGAGSDIDIDTESVSAGTPSGTISNASASAGAEVGNGTDLSSVTNVRFVAYGLV